MAKSFSGDVFGHVLVGLSVIGPEQYVVMICACVHCRMKFAVAIVCLLMLNILVSVSGNCLLSHAMFTGSITNHSSRYSFPFPHFYSIHYHFPLKMTGVAELGLCLPGRINSPEKEMVLAVNNPSPCDYMN